MHQKYPGMIYHQNGEQKIVNSEQEELAATAWRRQPYLEHEIVSENAPVATVSNDVADNLRFEMEELKEELREALNALKNSPAKGEKK